MDVRAIGKGIQMVIIKYKVLILILIGVNIYKSIANIIIGFKNHLIIG